MAKMDWKNGMQSLARSENTGIDWRTGIQTLAKSEPVSEITAGPIELAETGGSPYNWADIKIAEYKEKERTDREEKEKLQFRRDFLEQQLKQKKIEQLRQERASRFPDPVAGWGGVPVTHFRQPMESTEKLVSGIKESTTPEARREALRMSMGYAGGMAPKHPVLLAGLGGAAAEAIYQIGQQFTGSPGAPETSGEAMKRIGKAGGIELTEEGLSRILMKAISPGAKIPEERRRTIEWMRQRGIEPTLAQTLESRGGIGILENVTESSFTGGPHMRLHKANVERQLRNYGDEIVTRFGGIPDADAGSIIQDLISNTKATRQMLVKPMYEEVERLSKGRLMPTRPVREKAVMLLRDISRRGVSKEATSIMPSLENKQLVRILRDVATMPEYVPYKDINWARQQIGQIAFAHPMEKTGQMFTKQSERALQELYFDMSRIYQNPKYGLPSEATEILRRANDIVSESHDIFDKKLIKRLVKENPEKVVGAIIQKGSVTNIDDVLKAAGPESKTILRGAFVKDLITDKAITSTDEGVVLSGRKLLDYLDRKVGQEVVEKFMSKKEIEELRFFGDALRVYNAKPVQLGGGITIKLLQAAAILEIGHQAFPGAKGKTEEGLGTAATVLLGPKAISYLFTQPTLIRALSNTLISEGTPRQATRLLTRIFANEGLKKYIKEDESDREKRASELRREAAMQYQHLPL